MVIRSLHIYYIVCRVPRFGVRFGTAVYVGGGLCVVGYNHTFLCLYKLCCFLQGYYFSVSCRVIGHPARHLNQQSVVRNTEVYLNVFVVVIH